jgi:hypothetical protein
MRMVAHVFLALVLLSVLLLSKASLADDGSDSQIWLEQTVGTDLTESLTLNLDQSLRYGDSLSKMNVYQLSAGLQYHKLSWIEHGGYMVFRQDRSGEENVDEWRPTYDLSLKWDWGGARWINRNRLEYRMLDGRSNRFRYRDRLMVMLPFEMTKYSLKPYVAGEWFTYFDSDTIFDSSRLRGMIGIRSEPDGFIRMIELKDGRRITWNLYLMLQRTETSTSHLNEQVLGFKVGYFF